MTLWTRPPWVDGGPFGAARLIRSLEGTPIAVAYGERENPKAIRDTRLIVLAPELAGALERLQIEIALTGAEAAIQHPSLTSALREARTVLARAALL